MKRETALLNELPPIPALSATSGAIPLQEQAA
jgi:hypothetical protein